MEHRLSIVFKDKGPRNNNVDLQIVMLKFMNQLKLRDAWVAGETFFSGCICEGVPPKR